MTDPTGPETREREITRKALLLCLSHPVDCGCAGCTDIHASLTPRSEREERKIATGAVRGRLLSAIQHVEAEARSLTQGWEVRATPAPTEPEREPRNGFIRVSIPEPKQSPALIEIEYDDEMEVWVPRGTWPWDRKPGPPPTDTQPVTPERLREDLERFGAHHEDCYWLNSDDHDAGCNCGWAQAIRQHGISRDPEFPGPPLEQPISEAFRRVADRGR